MANISDIDKNFKIGSGIAKDNVRFYDAKSNPFKIYGVFYEGGKFRRMPESVAKSVSSGVSYLHANASGGRLRFVTDSSYVAISANLDRIGKMPHFAITGTAGFDLYADLKYVKTFTPPFNISSSYESVIELGGKKEREILINFPLYSDVVSLHVGLEEDAVIRESAPYVNDKPIVYYGSSITQGGCASRAGANYQSIISRRFNCDFVNLGFSGSARGENEIIEYIKGLEMSMFVLDYDHNAPSPAHLAATHEKMFLAVRETHPDIPIIMMPRPAFYPTEDELKRAQIVEKTYNNAKARGDKNVYYIDGKKLFELCKNDGTVDNCHPTDLGFFSMAAAIGEVIEKNGLI